MQTEKLQPAQETTALSLASLGKRISERESNIDARRLETASAALKTIQLVIEQGKDLLAAKTQAGHGLFLPWLAANFPKTPRTAQLYMAVAIKCETVSYLDDAKLQVELFKVAGLLPETEPQLSAGGGLVVPPIIQRLNFVAEWLAKESDKVSTWNAEQREAMKEKLRPVVEIYALL